MTESDYEMSLSGTRNRKKRRSKRLANDLSLSPDLKNRSKQPRKAIPTKPKSNAKPAVKNTTSQQTPAHPQRNISQAALNREIFSNIAVSTANRFADLDVEDTQNQRSQNALPRQSGPRNSVQPNSIPKSKAKTESRIPPAVITSNATEDIFKLLKECDVPHMIDIKRTCIRVLPATECGRLTLIEKLNTARVHFYTHAPKSIGTFKSLLRGLPSIENDEIIQQLSQQYDLNPNSVIGLPSNNPHSKLYIVEFNSKDITRAELANVRYIDNIRVSWEKLKRKEKGPTVCRNCCMLGHGMRGCYRIHTCLLCAGEHTADQCPMKNSATPRYRCANCAQRQLPHTHRADDDACPSRLSYIQSRQSGPKTAVAKSGAETHKKPIQTSRGPPPKQSRRQSNNGPTAPNKFSVSKSKFPSNPELNQPFTTQPL